MARPLELRRADIGGDRLIVLAHRRRAESFAGPRPEAILAHHTPDALLGYALAGLMEILPDAGRP